MQQREPPEILALAIHEAAKRLDKSFVSDDTIAGRVYSVCRCEPNRACVRLLMASALAKIHKPGVDIRKPYTEIGNDDAYSGRNYDESYLTDFIHEHDLPCNRTTAFLTPAWRNRNEVLTRGTNLLGRPGYVYDDTIDLLNDVHDGHISAEDLLRETVRCLLVLRGERHRRLQMLMDSLRESQGGIPPSTEDVVTLIEQHLQCPKSSRLPVLVVAAAYNAATEHLRERVLPLEDHTAADSQTGAFGDVQITLVDDARVVTTYEMKDKRVTKEDVDGALEKVVLRISQGAARIDNCILVTTGDIDESVARYARSLYEQTGGIEFSILDCIGFLRHILHLFHRLRIQFLDAYQDLLLAEPESAVSQVLKEAFLTLRKAAESAYS